MQVEGLAPQTERLVEGYLACRPPECRLSLPDNDPDGEFIALHRAVSAALLPHQIIPFHAVALTWRGSAVLFAAPSGTGKSTHARLWKERWGERVTLLCGDKPMLSFAGNCVEVWGTPWNGKERLGEQGHAPVAAVVVLHQAERNSLRPLTPGEALPLLVRQTHLPAEGADRMRVVELVGRLSQKPCYSLGCTISQEAVDLSFNILKENI